jgi:hypothetical protein
MYKITSSTTTIAVTTPIHFISFAIRVRESSTAVTALAGELYVLTLFSGRAASAGDTSAGGVTTARLIAALGPWGIFRRLRLDLAGIQNLLFCSRMRVVVSFSNMFRCQMSIDLGGGNIGMAQQLLDHAQVGSAV